MGPDAAYLARLGRQSMGRPLTPFERQLADAMEAIFKTGDHDFTSVAHALQQSGLPLPSGAAEGWTIVTLEAELRRINDSLDRAYMSEQDNNHAPNTG